MKINLKNLKGEVFSVEIEPTASIGNLKQRIQADKGITAESMKIIFKGKTTKDDESLEKLGLKETDFLVVMSQVSKPPAKPKVEEKEEAPKPQPQQKPANKPTEKKENGLQPSSEGSQAQINDLMAMGFPREECVAALRAAYGHSDRAVEYLLGGIPSNSQQGQTQNNNPMAGLQNLPEFGQMRAMLQNDPNSLPQILAQLSTTSPQLYNMIMQHPEQLENLLMGDMGEQDEGDDEIDVEGEYYEGQGDSGQPQEGQIVISQQEQAAINRLSDLGFSKIEAAQAYIACDKNEQLAANLLFERLANGDLQQHFPGDHEQQDDDNLFN